MLKLLHKMRRLSYCFILSIVAHVAFAYGFRLLGTYDFGAAVNPPQFVMVALTDPAPVPAAALPDSAAAEPEKKKDVVVIKTQAASREAEMTVPKAAEPIRSEAEPAAEAAAAGEIEQPEEEEVAPVAAPQPPKPAAVASAAAPASNVVSTVPSAQYEKLTYQISSFGLPMGSAELESKNENGVTSVALRIKSNLAMSSVFPVDDVIETTRIDGRYIVTAVKQREGSFRSDEMISINMQKKTVAWNDLVNGRHLKVKVPSSDVLDSLSGIYSLRTRPLEVGKTETLHIYDSATYADVPVEVLRREEIRLPNLTKVATLVVRPVQKTAGMFRKTGDVLIWMTDDEKKVPVKIVTSVAVGKVTVELVSAETTPHPKEGPAPSRVGQATVTSVPRL